MNNSQPEYHQFRQGQDEPEDYCGCGWHMNAHYHFDWESERARLEQQVSELCEYVDLLADYVANLIVMANYPAPEVIMLDVARYTRMCELKKVYDGLLSTAAKPRPTL